MTISTDTVDAVAAACRDRLGDPSAWVASDAYRQSLALCIIESVQSTSGHSEVTVVDRYLAYRKAREDKPVTDGARELLRTFEEAGSSDQWAGKIGSYKRRYTATGVPDRGTAHPTGRRETPSLADQQRRGPAVGRRFRQRSRCRFTMPGWTRAEDGSEVTWAHLLMLAGIPHTDLGTAAGHLHQRDTRHHRVAGRHLGDPCSYCRATRSGSGPIGLRNSAVVVRARSHAPTRRLSTCKQAVTLNCRSAPDQFYRIVTTVQNDD